MILFNLLLTGLYLSVTIKLHICHANLDELESSFLMENHQNYQKYERRDTTLSHRQSGKHLVQEDMASSTFTNKDSWWS
jgi:hypothetical protein